ncbi:MAG: Uma2 family endonuclease [Coleofasciculaceae cyanobacterium SM2_1_6]|nr:Uma2 family endonuclease [Coleofasciculaceae cyanobacterium SM2_1_6]
MVLTTLELRQIEVKPGNCLTLHDVSWQQFEQILTEMGDDRHAHIAYYQGNLEIQMPSPEHEKAKVLIGEFIKILLDELKMEWEPYGSTTFRREEMLAGIEPDDCFYIENARKMIGMRTLDLSVDPPPDLAIEIDVTSKTEISAYTALGVKELWRYADQKLQILQLQGKIYVEVKNSPTFPNLPVRELIMEFLEMSRTDLASVVRRGFRQRVQEQLLLNS